MINARMVRELRGERTQAEVAWRAGITSATLSAIENGHTTHPDLNTVEQLAKTLGVKPGDLIIADED